MKKVSCILFCLVVILSGCTSKSTPEPKIRYGNLTLNILSEGMTAQTIEPELDMGIAVYDVYGVGPNGAGFQRLEITSATITVETIQTGNWEIIVEAKNAGGTVVGEGNAQVTIVINQTVPAEVNVTPRAGNGTLNVNISWPAGSLVNPSVDAILSSLGGTLFPITFTLGVEGDSAHYENTGLDAGYYTLVLRLKDGESVVWGAIEAVRVLAGQVSEGNIPVELEGDADIVIIPDLQNPITITFSGCQEELEQNESMIVTAETSVPVDTYQWYLNGSLLPGETNASVGIGPDLAEGNYRLDLVVTKGNFLSSNHLNFTVTAGAE